MNWPKRNHGGARSAVVAADRLLLAPTLRKPLAVRSIWSATRLPEWIRFDRRDLGFGITLAAAATVINASGSLPVLRDRSLLEVAEYVGITLLDLFIICLAIVAALKVVERLPILGWRRHLTTIATGIAMTVVIAGPHYLLGWVYAAPIAVTYGVTSSPMALLLYAVWLNAALALIARAWLVKSDEEANASKLLTRIRSEQISVRRRLVEGRLKSIQARVDPLFFFDMLDVVQKTYTISIARAEQLLDELTVFLRAALPRLHTASSTVDQECDLARSFACLRTLAGLGEPRLDFDIAPTLGTARFPPGVLLPLVDELLRATANADSVRISFSTHALGADGPTGPISSEAQVESARPMLVMQLAARTNPSKKVLVGVRTQLDSLGAIADARATLLDLFGVNAGLTSIAVDGGVRTTVRIPYEPASA